jgi:acyl-CoA synthetase (NDP forming)
VCGDLTDRARELLASAQRFAREPLPDPEAFDLVEALGFPTPHRLFAADAKALAELDLDGLPGKRVVLKAVAPGLVHKTERGAVATVEKSHGAIAQAADEMAPRLGDGAAPGFLLCEHIAHDDALGGELLLSLRWSAAYGPLVTLAPGGVQAELLADRLDGGRAAAVLSPALALAPQRAVLERKTLPRLLTHGHRGRPPSLGRDGLEELLRRALELAEVLLPQQLSELEINPLVLTASGPIALDVLARPAATLPPATTARPLDKLGALLEPTSIAIIGVSSGENPGRIILRNVLASGFDAAQVTVIKPGRETLDGVRCVPDVGALAAPVDLLVVALEAARIPGLLDEVLRHEAAESLILIPGGLGERAGSEGTAERLFDSLAATRATTWRGPLINGGNCLGIRSLPGRYDTTFIPEEKLPRPTAHETPLAVISQSGAFAVSRASRLTTLNPRYSISLGNQLDLTVGDYLDHLADRPEVEVYACYVEGFRPLDGRKWLEATSRITAHGGTVILYQAGRTRAGADAAASHTASMAGGWQATRELAEAAGALVAEELADFEDLTRLACRLRGRSLGPRLGVLSNAGFECVAAADAAGDFELATLSAPTRQALEELLRGLRLEAVVAPRNPLDVTPIAADAAFAQAAELLIGDPAVDVAVVGCVPLTGALATLADDLDGAGAVASRLGRLWDESGKAWVAVVDAGPLYDPLAAHLETLGIPTFRRIDRALRLLGRVARQRHIARRLTEADL